MCAIDRQLENLCVVKAWPHTQMRQHSLKILDELVRFHAMPNARGKPRQSAKHGGNPQAELVGVGLTNWLGDMCFSWRSYPRATTKCGDA